MTRGIVGLVLLFASAGVSAAPGGQQLFVDKKCNKCHSVEAKGIAVLPKENDDGDDGDDGDQAKKPKDLSKVGTEHDAAYMQGWIRREVEKEGKKHKFKVKATDEEIAALSDWLASLK